MNVAYPNGSLAKSMECQPQGRMAVDVGDGNKSPDFERREVRSEWEDCTELAPPKASNLELD